LDVVPVANETIFHSSSPVSKCQQLEPQSSYFHFAGKGFFESCFKTPGRNILFSKQAYIALPT
jgi:hypothetical protein